jgi:hypothetical protein
VGTAAALINHIVGGQFYSATLAAGDSAGDEAADFAAVDPRHRRELVRGASLPRSVIATSHTQRRRRRRRRYGVTMFDVRSWRRVDGALVLVVYRGDW